MPAPTWEAGTFASRRATKEFERARERPYNRRFTAMGQKQSSTLENSQTFETAIERLEAIVEQMEGDKLPLEQLLERYEEGSKLVKVCQEKLQAAEHRIELIARGASGKPQAVPFDPSTPAPAPSPAPQPKKPAPAASAADVSLF
jgi:exodeoxyribonuclease VII small subunit